MKLCRKCKGNFPEDKFNKNKNKPDGLQDVCRDCSHARFKEYYHKNKERHKKVVRQAEIIRTKKKLEKIKTIKANSNGCLICGEKEICCLQFHHLDSNDKVNNISTLVGTDYGWRRILDEIKKCVIVCANCHFKLHKGLVTLPALSYSSYYTSLLS